MNSEDTSVTEGTEKQTETAETTETAAVEYKAYHLKELGEDLKEEGLELAEEAVEKVYFAFKKWLKKSAKATSTPIDDLVVGFIDKLDPIVMPVIDKIDGEVG